MPPALWIVLKTYCTSGFLMRPIGMLSKSLVQLLHMIVEFYINIVRLE